MVWKLDGLSEYDVRRPLTATCTNLLGLVKHLSIVKAWYFGKTFDRPFAEDLPWWDEGAEEQITRTTYGVCGEIEVHFDIGGQAISRRRGGDDPLLAAT